MLNTGNCGKGTALALNNADCEMIRTLVRQRSGIVLEEEKAYLVETRLSGLARREGFASIDQLLTTFRARTNTGLLEKVVEVMTTNETSFFRDIQPFEALTKVVIPELMERRARDRELNIWCGAASSGQEPFSMAIMLRENFPALNTWKINFTATDISQEMLEKCRKGLYSQLEVNRGLSAKLLVKYFTRKGMEYELTSSIRNMIDFKPLNLIEAWPKMPSPDIVMLRNVLIYFDVETKKTILGKIRRLMRPDGYLFLGGAETTMNLDDAFERAPFDRTSYYRLRQSK